MKRAQWIFWLVVGLIVGGISDTARAQSIGPNGGLEIEGVPSGQPVPMSATSLPLPSGAALEAGGNLAAVASAVQSVGSTAGTKGLLTACTDGGTGRALFCDGSGHLSIIAGTTLPIQGASGGTPVAMLLSAPTRHDFGSSLASGSTLLASGVGVLLASQASTSAVLGGNLCFYDGVPGSGGVLIGAYGIATASIGSFAGIPSQGVPYANGLYVRAGSVLVACTSLGTTLALGYGWALTLP